MKTIYNLLEWTRIQGCLLRVYPEERGPQLEADIFPWEFGIKADESHNGGTSKTVSQISLRLVVYGDGVAGQEISISYSSQEN